MSISRGPLGRVIALGRFDESTSGDWLLLRLVVRGLALVPLAVGLVLALVHAFVASYLRAGRPTERAD